MTGITNKSIYFEPSLGSSVVMQLLGSFSNDDGDGDGNQNVEKKAIGFLRETTTLHVHHAFL